MNLHIFKKSRVIIHGIILLFFALLIQSAILYSAEEIPEEENKKNEENENDTIENEEEDNILLDIPVEIYNYLKDRPEEMWKYLKSKKYYRQKKDKDIKDEGLPAGSDPNVGAIKQSASDEMQNVLVFVSEIPASRENVIYAPIFMADRKSLFGTRTDFSLKWVGYKATLNFKQNKFPWESTSLTETLIGSFLYASGTNTGFNRGKSAEEIRFYTNYFSEIVTLKRKFPAYISAAVALDSRQYFFVEKDAPPDYIMPLNHFNVFPRIDLNFDMMKEKGIDQLSSGIRMINWAGYGVRNRWEEWGEPGNLHAGEHARKFLIYSSEIAGGLLFHKNHNFILKAHYKGGINNDYLTKPRFGGTIDNARLDVVHGFTMDQFRVEEFLLLNSQYGFDIVKRLRFNLFFDYAHIYKPDAQDLFGSGWGVRILSWGGMPIWFTHGIGKEYRPREKSIEQVFMIMTAIGW